MPDNLYDQLSRRERQIMDIILERGEATAADIQNLLPDPPGNSSIRVLLRILEEKGHLTHREEGGRYIYAPTEEPEKVRRFALRHLLKTFFGGSVPNAVSALLSAEDLSQAELDELARMIEAARQDSPESGDE
jgi:BlaI family penicillinase repressor